MDATEPPRLYLITPPVIETKTFPDQLAAVLDGIEIACVRLALAGRDEDALGRAADACLAVTLARDVPLTIDDHVLMSQCHGLDGVHLTDGARSVRGARKTLGSDAIVGAFCGTSRHDGMTAGEAGVDYVSFGPVTGSLGDGALADQDLFQWWSEMIEVPVVAEGGMTHEAVAALAEITDFLAIGDEIWGAEDPVLRLKEISAGVV